MGKEEKEQEEVTDVGRARRRHLRRIRMRGGRGRASAGRRKKCYGRPLLLTRDNRSA